MLVRGTFDPPAMAHRYQNYPAFGPGTIEVTPEVVRITARPLALVWLQSLLGILGFCLGLVLMFVGAKLDWPTKVYMVIWLGPAIGGVVLGHVLGRRVAARRAPIVRDIPRAKVTDAGAGDGGGCQILVKAGLVSKQAIHFTPSDRAETNPLVSALQRTR